ncbi:hypothetical protein NSE_0208 [Neorickettsia sennetsu str. Miyayama]|uniref:Uncharacterized protein n=2 Tax=Ehrlichia sennetsu TaxID=951 RepID=Q2GEJ3_EHRS3|nr:hypothetical protein NSE_0208 [Neorickettsia sennetsu str. Miyayama]
MEKCLKTYVAPNRVRSSLSLSQGTIGRKEIPEDAMSLLLCALERKLSCVVRDYTRLKKLQRGFVFAELAALCVFTVGSLTIFVALLRRNLLMSSTLDKVVEIAFLLGTAVFFATFLLRRFFLPRVRADIVNRIDCYEEILDPKRRGLSEIVCKIREDCKPSCPTRDDRIANCLRFFTLLGGLVLEVLLVVNLFRDFGLTKVRVGFLFMLDDTLELIFTLVGLLCTSLYLYSYYSKQQNKSVDKKDCASTEKTPFLQRAPNALWVSFGAGLLSLGNRILRGFEGTGLAKISLKEGVIRLGLLFATLLCLLDIYLISKTQEELIESELVDVSVSARAVPLVIDIVA